MGKKQNKFLKWVGRNGINICQWIWFCFVMMWVCLGIADYQIDWGFLIAGKLSWFFIVAICFFINGISCFVVIHLDNKKSKKNTGEK